MIVYSPLTYFLRIDRKTQLYTVEASRGIQGDVRQGSTIACLTMLCDVSIMQWKLYQFTHALSLELYAIQSSKFINTSDHQSNIAVHSNDQSRRQCSL